MKCKITILLILVSSKIISQSCDGFNKNTYQSTTAVWDWRNDADANWMAQIDYGLATPTIRSIASPFAPSSIGSRIHNIYG